MARLRSSAWLPLLVLLVFMLKIGSAAACADHEFADAQRGGDAVLVADLAGEDVPGALAAHAASCTHCSCHHSAAIVPGEHATASSDAVAMQSIAADRPPSTVAALDLRPPIA